MDKTKEIVASMLVENTGRHILDSGGAYGRHWERAQTALKESPYASAVEMFDAQPAVTWDYGPTINVYHFLTAALEYNEQLDRAWEKWVYSGPEDRYINGCATADEFIERLVKKGWATEPREIWYGSGWVNTYNNEDALSQVIQYVMFQLTYKCPWNDGSDDVVLLSIHGGADVRGGYTELRAFNHYTDDSPSLWDNARIELYCNNVEDHRQVNKRQLNYEGKEEPPDYEFYYRAYSEDAGYSWNVDEDHELLPVSNPDNSELIPKCPLCNNDLEVGAMGL